MAYLSGCLSPQCTCFIIELEQLLGDCVCTQFVSRCLLGFVFPLWCSSQGSRCSRSAWCYWLDTFFCIIIRPPFTSQAHVRRSFRDSTGIQNMLKTLLQPHLKYIITNHLLNHSATNHLIWFSIYRLPKSYPTGNISAYLLLNLSERWCQNVLLCLEAVFMPVLGLHRR